ncbi:hypothetical protein SNF32_10530 [Enterococcus mundtii]|nr:hypothetical protein [Enterococcus mundtii]
MAQQPVNKSINLYIFTGTGMGLSRQVVTSYQLKDDGTIAKFRLKLMNSFADFFDQQNIIDDRIIYVFLKMVNMYI